MEAVSHETVFSRVPEEAPDARIHFAGSTRLTGPGGEDQGAGEPLSGWIDLPEPGLWQFTPVDNQPVTLEGAPPFFAFRDPAYHFIPDSLADTENGDDEDDD